jgi:hypothetical protein
MMKRLRWLLIGAAVGAVGVSWITRRAREAVPQKGADAFRSAREGLSSFGSRLRDALREGRRAAEDKRRELSEELIGR